MKPVEHIYEWKDTSSGKIKEVEIEFVDGTSVKYTVEGDNIKREGNL